MRAEAAGFSTLLGTDHVGRWSATFLLLTAALATQRLRIGTYVVNNDLRNPVLLAQEFATLDLLSLGRLEIGLGAGWMAADYAGTGIPFDPPGQRLRRLESTIGVIKEALRYGLVDRPADAVYPAARADKMPISVQRPYPPILVGGGGPRMLSLAGRVADIVSFNPRSTVDGRMDVADAGKEAFDRKVALVRDAAGPRWSGLELNANLFGVNPTAAKPHGPAADLMAGMSNSELKESPHFLFGDVNAMQDQLEERRDRWGLSYIVARQADFDAIAPLVERMQSA
jgi:probable F420-dependent oxidoreductase